MGSKKFMPLITITPFVFPTEFDEKYEIVRGNSWIVLSYVGQTFLLDVFYIQPIRKRIDAILELNGTGLGSQDFATEDLIELIRKNPRLAEYELGLQGQAKHVLIVVLDGNLPNAFIAPIEMLENLYTIPRDRIVTSIRELATEQGAERDREKTEQKESSLELAKRSHPIFICHEGITGNDFSEFLRKGFRKKKGISCFAFEFDMPKAVTKGSLEWESIIDKVIDECHTFFILLTDDELTDQMAREFKRAMDRLARDAKFSIVVFRRKGVSRTSETILSKIKVDTSKLNQNDFGSEEDLMRQALGIVDNEGYFKTSDGSSAGQDTTELGTVEHHKELKDLVLRPWLSRVEDATSCLAMPVDGSLTFGCDEVLLKDLKENHYPDLYAKSEQVEMTRKKYKYKTKDLKKTIRDASNQLCNLPLGPTFGGELSDEHVVDYLRERYRGSETKHIEPRKILDPPMIVAGGAGKSYTWAYFVAKNPESNDTFLNAIRRWSDEPRFQTALQDEKIAIEDFYAQRQAFELELRKLMHMTRLPGICEYI